MTEQLVIEVREPSPEDYKRAAKKPEKKNEVSGDIKISPLGQDEVEKLYSRAEDIKEKEEDEKEYFKREKSIKPPRKGDIVEQSFPPPIKLEKPAELLKEEEEMKKALKVIRFMPEGKDFETVPQIIVTFNQPMVPLTGVDDLKKYPVPVEITPKIEGEWRWIGTKTVKWKPSYRCPKSTEYKVTIPSGVKSELGCELKEKVEFGFTTKTLSVTKFMPGYHRVGEKGIGFIEFNQDIKVEDVMKHFTIVGGRKTYKVVLITPDEVQKRIDIGGIMKKKQRSLYNSYGSHIKNGIKGRHLWFAFEEPLALDTAFVLTISKGCPSAEGPRLTEANLTQRFNTYGPFVKTRHHPKASDRIVPNQSFSVTFSNNIELDELDGERDIDIQPPIKNCRISPSGSTISIQGQTKGNTNYTITFKTSMTDIYGQNLREETKVSFNVGRARQSMYGFFNGQMIVHDMCMNDKPQFEIVSINLAKIHVCVYQVDPWEFQKSGIGADYSWYQQQWGYKTPLNINQRVNCGRKVFDKVIEVENSPDELVETIIPLSDFLKNKKEKCGHLFMYVEPDEKSWKKNSFKYAPRIRTWMQVTHLAVDAVSAAGGEVYGFCTQLKDGKSVNDAKFTYMRSLRRYVKPKLQKEKYEGAQVSVIGKEDGTSFFSKCTDNAGVFIAEKGVDSCFVRNLRHYNRETPRMLHYIVNDRNLYKPKETVSVKGVFRHMGHTTWERVLKIPSEQTVKWIAYDPRGSKLKEGSIKLNKFGSFFMTLELPDNVNLGQGRIQFTLKNQRYEHNFKIQEFRTPEFSSSASCDPGPYYMNGVAILDGKAEYFSGGGLSGCDAHWIVKQTPTSYYPPSFTFQGYSFDCSYHPLHSKEITDINSIISSIPLPSIPGRSNDIFSQLLSSSVPSLSVKPSPIAAPVEKPGEFHGKTDGSGEHKLAVQFDENKDVDIKKPSRVSCDLNIQDINRQMMSSSTSFLVHPSKYYVGIKKKKYFARKGDALPVDLIVTDVDGKTVENVDIEFKIFHRYWERKGYNWNEIEEKVLDTKFVSKKEPLPVDLKLENGGTFYFVCKVVDPEGMANYSSSSLWVAGGKERKSGGSRVQQEIAKLIGNQKEFKVGDEAKILISSPFSPAEGIMAVICNGFVQRERFSIKEDSTVVTVPILREYIPNAKIYVYLAGVGQRIDENTGRPSAGAPVRPAYAFGNLVLPIPPEAPKLQIEVEPEAKIMKPGEESNINIKVTSKDPKFKNANTAVSLIVVDEAVLSLTGYELPHPISNFYPSQNVYQNVLFFRNSVVMKNWSSIRVEAPPVPVPVSAPCCFSCCAGAGPPGGFRNCCPSAPMRRNRCCCHKKCCECKQQCKMECESCDCLGCCDDDALGGLVEEEEEAIEVRTNFNPLACFIHDTVTDKDGKAIIPFKLPDNLTRYRVWVLALSGEDQSVFGLGESSIQAQLPLAIRPSLPRFLNYGDNAQFTVVVQNQTLGAIKVKVGVRMTNLRLLDESQKGQLVEIPYNKRAELRFPVKTHKCGTGRFQIIGSVVGTKFADAVEKELPIFTPCTSEAFATYGELDGDATCIQAVIPPESVYNQFGGLSITTSSTALQALTDAFLYLYNYKFDCVEQISSRMLSINALQKFLYEFNVPKMPTKKEVLAVMLAGFKKIRGAMRTDGALGFWSLTSRVNIYLSIYVAHNLIRCKENGYEVDPTLLNRSKSFCQNIDRYINSYCDWYGEYSKASVRAFALYVLSIYGVNGSLSKHEMDELSKRAENLYKTKKKFFNHEGKVWLMFCLFVCSRKKEKHPVVKEILGWIMNNVEESPETAHFITSYGDDGKLVMLHSNRRTDGVILEVLCHVDPKNYLIPKIVKGLLAHRKKGRWTSTQENVYILMALKKYFEVFENIVPDFLCRVWLGEDYAGEVKFKGREVDYKQIYVPMKALVPDENKLEKKDLVLFKQGKGRMYYRLGMDYAPKSHDLKPIDYGFVVERTYEGVTEKDHCKKLESGEWLFKAGELIKVKLRMTNVSRRFHVALVDSIPAGCEVLNPELKGTQKVPGSAKVNMSSNTNRSPYRWYWWYCWRPWYEHVNLRDERVEAFSSYLYCGTHEYEYVMRATCLGNFVVPPAKAEEMYAPELFGRSASEKVIIKE